MAEPDWNDLRVLLAVGRTGKLSAAAIKLRADHATVSRRISALEDALQVKLLERRSTGVTLTEQGAQLMAWRRRRWRASRWRHVGDCTTPN